MYLYANVCKCARAARLCTRTGREVQSETGVGVTGEEKERRWSAATPRSRASASVGVYARVYIFIRVRSVKHARVHIRERMRGPTQRVHACTHDDSECR